jgi:hypothetical protein
VGGLGAKPMGAKTPNNSNYCHTGELLNTKKYQNFAKYPYLKCV